MTKDNTLFVKRIASIEGLKEVSSALAKAGVEYHAIDKLNWPNDFPYKPDVCFAIAHSSDAIILDFKVKEDSVVAKYDSDKGHVWEDSCVELFLSVDGKAYYNFEFNCIATLYACYGPDRHDREFLSESSYKAVKRYASLGTKAFEEKECKEPWSLSVIIPVSALNKHEIKALDNTNMKCNLQKCGDSLSKVHFLSYSAILTAKPDFHRPEFFTDIHFE